MYMYRVKNIYIVFFVTYIYIYITATHAKTFRISQLNKITKWCRERKIYYLATKILTTQLCNWMEQKDINTQTEQELSSFLK